MTEADAFPVLITLFAAGALIYVRLFPERIRTRARTLTICFLLIAVCLCIIWTLHIYKTRAIFTERLRHIETRQSLIASGVSFDKLLALETAFLLGSAVHRDGSGGILTVDRTVTFTERKERASRTLAILAPGTRLVMPMFGGLDAGRVEVKNGSVTGWVDCSHVVISYAQAQAGFVGWSESPYLTLTEVTLMKEPYSKLPSAWKLSKGSKIARSDQLGSWLEVRSKPPIRGWVHSSKVRLLVASEETRVTESLWSLALQEVFPEKTLAGKCLGFAGGLIVTLVWARVVQRLEWLDMLKVALPLAYFLAKTLSLTGNISFNEIGLLGVFAFGLTLVVDAVSERLLAIFQKPGNQ